MRPRNDREREVYKLSHTLGGLSDAKILWAVEKVMPHNIYTSGKKCWCSVCGQEFEVKEIGEKHECPNCHRTSEVVKSRKQLVRDFAYLQVITTNKGWQVLQYVLFKWYARKGDKLTVQYMPVLEKWCRPGQQTITLGAYLKVNAHWQNQPYSEYSNLTIKEPSYFNQEWMKVFIYPRKKVLPTYLKCGFEEKMLESYTAENIFGDIFAVPHFEQLYKQGKTKELDKRLPYSFKYQKNWNAIRIALRHGFDPCERVNYLENYFDYLAMLKFLHKDLRSPHYVAPKDWNEMHRQIVTEASRKRGKIELVRRQRENLRRAQEEEERLKQEKEGNKSFEKRIKKFSGLMIVGDDVHIAPLMSIQDFADEGRAMNHCVFSNAYYRKEDSLILSARDDSGHRIETIEVSISQGKVLQSHGVNNAYTNRHDEIVSLVTGNIPLIQKMSKKKSRSRISA